MTNHCIIYESYGAKDLRGVAFTMYKYIVYKYMYENLTFS